MKKIFLFILLALMSLTFMVIHPALAQAAFEDLQLEHSANETNKEAAQPNGQKQVVEKLKKQFNVTDARINQLKSQKMGYGEIKIALSLAQQMPGGITDENVQKIMNLRNGDKKMGWGKVAKELNLNVGDAVKKVKSDDQRMKASGQKEKTKSNAATSTGQSQPSQNKGQMNKGNMSTSQPTKSSSHSTGSSNSGHGKK